MTKLEVLQLQDHLRLHYRDLQIELGGKMEFDHPTEIPDRVDGVMFVYLDNIGNVCIRIFSKEFASTFYYHKRELVSVALSNDLLYPIEEYVQKNYFPMPLNWDRSYIPK